MRRPDRRLGLILLASTLALAPTAWWFSEPTTRLILANHTGRTLSDLRFRLEDGRTWSGPVLVEGEAYRTTLRGPAQGDFIGLEISFNDPRPGHAGRPLTLPVKAMAECTSLTLTLREEPSPGGELHHYLEYSCLYRPDHDQIVEALHALRIPVPRPPDKAIISIPPGRRVSRLDP